MLPHFGFQGCSLGSHCVLLYHFTALLRWHVRNSGVAILVCYAGLDMALGHCIVMGECGGESVEVCRLSFVA